MSLPEDKREKIRLASDTMLKFEKLDDEVQRAALEQFRFDRLTVLKLTDQDKRFLQSLRIST